MSVANKRNAGYGGEEYNANLGLRFTKRNLIKTLALLFFGLVLGTLRAGDAPNSLLEEYRFTAKTNDELRKELSLVEAALPPKNRKEFQQAFDSIMDQEWEKLQRNEWANTPVGAIGGLSVRQVIEKGKAIDVKNKKSDIKKISPEKLLKESYPIDLREDKPK